MRLPHYCGLFPKSGRVKDSNTDTLKGLRSENKANFKLLHEDNRELKELIAHQEHSTEERIEALAAEINAEKRGSSGWKQPSV